MFAGLDFSMNAISYTCTPVNETTSVTIRSGIYDDLFASDNPDKITKEWDYNTRFYAKFQNNLFAGNVNYSARDVSMMRVKRRKNNEHEWLKLFEIPISKNTDFEFELFDRYAQANQDYYYSLIPVINSVESNLNKSQIKSEFYSYFLVDKALNFPIFLNTSLNLELQNQTNIVNTLGSKYPFVISNTSNRYMSGNLTFGLIPVRNCELIVEDGYFYRKNFEEWITNGEPKILKDWTGQIYMVHITDAIPIDYSFYDMPTYTIHFVEIGNPLNEDDLYYNNFIDINYSLGG